MHRLLAYVLLAAMFAGAVVAVGLLAAAFSDSQPAAGILRVAFTVCAGLVSVVVLGIAFSQQGAKP